MPTSPDGRYEAAPERLLDDSRRARAGAAVVVVTRLRPGIVGKRTAGSGLLREGVTSLLPASALRILPFCPEEASACIHVVQADDVCGPWHRLWTPVSQVIAWAVTNNDGKFVVPAVAGLVGLAPLASLVDDEPPSALLH